MSSIVNALLVVGVLAVAVIGFQNRCEWFQLCDDGLGFGSASGSTGDVVNNYYDEDGNLTDAATDGVGTMTEATVGCCHCKFVGDRVKCEVNGDGNWYNPPMGEDGSNDQHPGLSAKVCYQEKCGGSTSKTTTTKSSGSSKMPANATPASSTANKPKTGNLGDKGTVYIRPDTKKPVTTPEKGKPASGGYPCNTGLCATSGLHTAACRHCPGSKAKFAKSYNAGYRFTRSRLSL